MGYLHNIHNRTAIHCKPINLNEPAMSDDISSKLKLKNAHTYNFVASSRTFSC